MFERHQKWDKYYLVNGDFSVDNLSQNSLPVDWKNVGVTNNFLSALIYDYGQLRLDAWQRGEHDFVAALDARIIEKFNEKINDPEAGATVIHLAKLRSFTLAASGHEEMDEEEKEKLRNELEGLLG